MFRMDRIVKQTIILALIAVLLGGVCYLSMPAYADGIYTEPAYMAKNPKFRSTKKGSRITLRWSKAYARLEDGTVSDVSGYEVQYSKKKSFAKAKTINKTSDSLSAVIDLKDLNTKKKYKKNINKYYIRVRSYVIEDGRKYYSSWTSASRTKKVKVYGHVVPATMKVSDNSTKLTWTAVSGCDGYVIYGREAGTSAWEKKYSTTKSTVKSFSEADLKYGTDYEYMILSYKTMATSNPSTLRASVLDALDESDYSARISIAPFELEKPEVSAKFDKKKLKITWSGSTKASKYILQYDTSSEFENPQDMVIDAESLISGDTYTYAIDSELETKTDYFVRVRSFAVYNGADYYSEYSEPAKARDNAETYTIKFQGSGSTTGKMGSFTVISGEDFALPKSTYTRDGYEFAGWTTVKPSDDPDQINMHEYQIGITEYMDGEEVRDLAEPNGTITLYACWRGASPIAAADWAIRIANNDTFCYGTVVRNQCWFCGDKYQTFNCNSLAAASYQHGMFGIISGFSKLKADGSFSRRNGSTEPKWWKGEGFITVGSNIDMSKIEKGDIICCYNGSRWSHVMIAANGPEAKTRKVAHAARKGTDAASITVAAMQTRLNKYKKYTVMRLPM